jgi:DNA-binding beta-propeller fold protein YncE
MKRNIGLCVALMIAGSVLGLGSQAAPRAMPRFEVDPSWPKLPNKWVLGLVSGVNIDPQDHVWILHRPRTVKPEQKAMAAPAVLEFDTDGTFIRAWGGPGEGYEWPETEHGISVDYRGFVWIAGSGAHDDQILKFTQDGKFLMQIGHSGQSKGNTDTKNVHQAADVYVYPKTNEVFVADGYGNRRVIVYDADTGAFKRMWGGFGHPPTDPPPTPPPTGGAAMPSGRVGRAPRAGNEDGPGPPDFEGVHGARVSNDELVYVADRLNQRVQVFTLAGKYLTQVFVSRGAQVPSTATGLLFGKPRKDFEDNLLNDPASSSRTAFSADAQQRFLYVIDRRHQRIAILERKSLELLGYFGGGVGDQPGQFYILHDIAADSKGNMYTAEVNEIGNRRAQKFVFKGLVTAPGR